MPSREAALPYTQPSPLDWGCLVKCTLVPLSLVVGLVAVGCTESGRSPTAPTGVQHALGVQLAQTLSWECGGGKILSGGDGWEFPRTPGCAATAAVSGGPAVALGLVTAAPTNFRSTVNGSVVQLAWEMAPDGVVSFLIEAGSAPALANLATLNTGTPATLLTVTNVPDGAYYVRARGIGTDGIPGPPSNEIVVRVGTAPTGLPGAPTQLRRQVTGNTVTLTWVAPGGGIAGYQVEAGSAPGLANVVTFDTGNPAAALVATAPSGLYYVRVRARNAIGVGPASNEIPVGVNVAEPPQSEVCGDGVDNDQDGAVDEDCNTSPPPPPPPSDPGPPSPPVTPPSSPACTFTLSRNAASMPFSGGSFDVTVTTNLSTCAWSASSSAGFVTIANGGPGTGSGSARFNVGSNTATGGRSGNVRIVWDGATQEVSVSQDGNTVVEVINTPVVPSPPGSTAAAPTVTSNNGRRPEAGAGPPVSATAIAPPPGTPAPPATTLRAFGLTSPQDFDHAIVSVDVPPQDDRQGTAAVANGFYEVDFHTAARVATVIIAVPNDTPNVTLQFAVSRNGATGPYASVAVTPTTPPTPACTYDFVNAINIPATGGNVDIAVTAPAGCGWSATSNTTGFIPNPPLTSRQGSGSGTVRFTAAANSSATPREGKIVVAWDGNMREVTITQAAAPCSFVLTSPSAPNLKLTSHGIGVSPEDRTPQAVLVTVAASGGANCSWKFDAGASPLVAFVSGADSGANSTQTMTLNVLANRTNSDRDVIVQIATASGNRRLTFQQAHPRARITVSWTNGRGLPHPDTDIDLKLQEPAGGTLIYWDNKVGTSGYLEDDNKPRNGTGTVEKIYIDEPLSGNYKVFFTHTGGGDDDTNSTITITLDPFGASQSRTFTRFTTREGTTVDVANVNVVTRTIIEILTP